MENHRRIWVEKAIENTEAVNAIQLRNLIREDDLSLKGTYMVTKNNALEYCDEYINDVGDGLCQECDIGCLPADNGYICPSCKTIYE